MNILVVGCSMTYGAGLKNASLDKNLWANKLFKDVFGNDVSITNGSKIGKNNHWIFLETMNYLVNNTYDLIVVAWSAIPRYDFHVDLELYSTHTMLNNKIPINTNRFGKTSPKQLTNTGNQLRKIHNDHWDILNLIKYINILVNSSQGKRIVFVNTLMEFSNDYFTHKDIFLPSELSKYERNLLNSINRNDKEVILLYNKIHKQYKMYGGIHEKVWLNLYDSLHSMQIDTSSDNAHPGYKSQKIYVQELKSQLISVVSKFRKN